MQNKEVRQSIRDAWEKFRIHPLVCFMDIDRTRYRVSPEGRIVRGEYYGDKAGLPLKVHYDKKNKMTYCNVKNNLDMTCTLYCEDMIRYHREYEEKFIRGRNNTDGV